MPSLAACRCLFRLMRHCFLGWWTCLPVSERFPPKSRTKQKPSFIFCVGIYIYIYIYIHIHTENKTGFLFRFAFWWVGGWFFFFFFFGGGRIKILLKLSHRIAWINEWIYLYIYIYIYIGDFAPLFLSLSLSIYIYIPNYLFLFLCNISLCISRYLSSSRYHQKQLSSRTHNEKVCLIADFFPTSLPLSLFLFRCHLISIQMNTSKLPGNAHNVWMDFLINTCDNHPSSNLPLTRESSGRWEHFLQKTHSLIFSVSLFNSTITTTNPATPLFCLLYPRLKLYPPTYLFCLKDYLLHLIEVFLQTILGFIKMTDLLSDDPSKLTDLCGTLPKEKY